MTHSRVLAERIFPGEGLALDAARIAAGNLLMVLCAWAALPLAWTPVPVTGQTLGVLLVATLFGARRAAIVMGLYLAEGLAGLPVFQPFGLPGALRLAGPTAGYLLAYPAAAFVTGWLVERVVLRAAGWGRTARLVGALLAGETVIFAGGVAWLAWLVPGAGAGGAGIGVGMGLEAALIAGLLPFLPWEALKMTAVVAIARATDRFRRA